MSSRTYSTLSKQSLRRHDQSHETGVLGLIDPKLRPNPTLSKESLRGHDQSHNTGVLGLIDPKLRPNPRMERNRYKVESLKLGMEYGDRLKALKNTPPGMQETGTAGQTGQSTASYMSPVTGTARQTGQSTRSYKSHVIGSRLPGQSTASYMSQSRSQGGTDLGQIREHIQSDRNLPERGKENEYEVQKLKAKGTSSASQKQQLREDREGSAASSINKHEQSMTSSMRARRKKQEEDQYNRFNWGTVDKGSQYSIRTPRDNRDAY